MRSVAALFATVFCSMAIQPAVAGYNDDLARLTRGMPHEIFNFIDRRANCNHWLGEDGYDAERRKMIEDALRELHCAALESDEMVLKQRFSGRPEILRALDQSKDWSPG